MLRNAVAVIVFSLICVSHSFSEESFEGNRLKDSDEKGCLDQVEYSVEDAKKAILEYELGLQKQTDNGEISPEEMEFSLEHRKNIDYDYSDLCYYASFNSNKVVEAP